MAVLAICCVGILSAQQTRIHPGFRMNSGLSWMTTNDQTITNVGSNFTAGIMANIEITVTDYLAVVTGLGLTFNQGGTLRHKTGGNFFPDSRLSDDVLNTGPKPLPDGTKLKYHIQYLDVPVGVKWRFGNAEGSKALGYYVEAPLVTWGVAIQRRGTITAGEIRTGKENISRDVSSVHVALGLGAGIEHPLDTKTSFFAGLYFNRGLNDITGNTAKTATPNPDENPFDPNDDYILTPENSRALLSTFTIHLGVVF